MGLTYKIIFIICLILEAIFVTLIGLVELQKIDPTSVLIYRACTLPVEFTIVLLAPIYDWVKHIRWTTTKLK